jgi:teichoic acid transport system permease protein
MKSILHLIREQIENLNLIYRLAIYEIKGKYQSHYLGVLWQFINPVIQISIYWFIFGMGIRGGAPVNGVPFFIWMLLGLIPWFFISPTIIQGSNSVYSKVNLVSKMKFPVSVLPSIVIVGNSFSFILMLLALMLILFIYGINPGLYFLQLPYYLICLYVFLYSITLLFSTISTIIRDFQVMLQSLMRMLMYFSPILWKTDKLPEIFQTILKLNPLYYIIEGFRKSFLGNGWFYQDLAYMTYFWSLTFLVLLLGSFAHLKFRRHFVDYI